MAEAPSDPTRLPRRRVLGGAALGAGALGAGALGLGALATTATAAPADMAAQGGVTPVRASAIVPSLTYVTIGGWHFRPLDATQQWDGVDANFRFVGASSGYCSVEPHLPRGAVLKEIELYGTRGAAGTVSLSLWRKLVTTGALDERGEATVPAVAGPFVATLAVDEPVDEATALGPFANIDAAAAPTTSLWGMRLGYQAPPTYVPLSPATRVLDTRTLGQTKLGDQEERIVPLGLPAGITRAVINLTVTETGPGGFVAVFPGDTSWPGTSSINWKAADQDVANTVIASTDAAGQIRLRAGGSATHVVVDVVGYFA